MTREEKLPNLKHDEIYVRSEILSISEDVAAKLDIESRNLLAAQGPFTDGDLEKLLRQRDMLLLMRPWLMIMNDQDGTIRVMGPKTKDNKERPGLELNIHPLIQADGSIQLNGKFTIPAGQAVDSPLESMTISRKIQPNIGHHECFGPVKIENADVYVFLKIYSAK